VPPPSVVGRLLTGVALIAAELRHRVTVGCQIRLSLCWGPLDPAPPPPDPSGSRPSGAGNAIVFCRTCLPSMCVAAFAGAAWVFGSRGSVPSPQWSPHPTWLSYSPRSSPLQFPRCTPSRQLWVALIRPPHGMPPSLPRLLSGRRLQLVSSHPGRHQMVCPISHHSPVNVCLSQA
jgi:hypothetical protein